MSMPSKQLTLDEFVSRLSSGIRLGIGGWGSRRKPMALMKLVYRDQIFPREPYRKTFERLVGALPERTACRRMVELLGLAHDRACEVELAALLAEDIAADRLPDMAMLRARFAPDPATLPKVVVQLAPLSIYDVLLMGDAA